MAAEPLTAPPPSAGPPWCEALADARLRRSRAFELRRFDELTAAEREAVADLERDGGNYGVLMPRAAGRTAKLVDRRMAALWRALAVPRPSGARARSDAAARELAALILDGVLEVEEGGVFVGGPRAHRLLFGAVAEPEPAGRLARLSRRALRYGAALPLDQPRALARRLYDYHRLPPSARWRERFGSRERLEAALGLGPHDRLTALLAESYEVEEFRGWRAWSRPGSRDRELAAKLYLSPHPDALPAGFRAAAETFAALGVPAFKVGQGLSGVLRADKLVAYFDRRDGMERAGRLLAEKLAGCRPHGVPFSAELAGDGLLSWGVDPPLEADLVPWRGLESWRLRLCNQLASSLVLARAEAGADGEGGVEPWRFALDRLRLDGVETSTWEPPPSNGEEVRS